MSSTRNSALKHHLSNSSSEAGRKSQGWPGTPAMPLSAHHSSPFHCVFLSIGLLSLGLLSYRHHVLTQQYPKGGRGEAEKSCPLTHNLLDQGEKSFPEFSFELISQNEVSCNPWTNHWRKKWGYYDYPESIRIQSLRPDTNQTKGDFIVC